MTQPVGNKFFICSCASNESGSPCIPTPTTSRTVSIKRNVSIWVRVRALFKWVDQTNGFELPSTVSGRSILFCLRGACRSSGTDGRYGRTWVCRSRIKIYGTNAAGWSAQGLVPGRCEHAGRAERTGWVERATRTTHGTKPAKTIAVYLKLMDLGKTPEASSARTPSVRRVRVGEEDAGQRIDNFLLRECKGVPKSHIYRVLRSGEVRVNGGRINQTYRLQAGDEVRIPPIRVAEKPPEPGLAAAARHDFPIVFEDDALLVIDKPAGLAVHGGSGLSFGVIELLRRQRPEARFLELAHRLDRETSGLLIIGKRRVALNTIQDAMRAGRMEKRYLAMVAGRWMNPVQHIKLALHKYLTPDGERRVTVSPDGKPSHSVVRLVRRWERFSLVEVELKTGRTHQIRVHMQSQGFPLLGDDKYGDFELNKALAHEKLPRMFLHAAKLRLQHPVTGEMLELASSLPPDLEGFLRAVDASQKRDYG